MPGYPGGILGEATNRHLEQGPENSGERSGLEKAAPETSQEEIAKACGFLSASSFNSTFKRITGYTPKVWAASNVPSGGPGTNLE